MTENEYYAKRAADEDAERAATEEAEATWARLAEELKEEREKQEAEQREMNHLTSLAEFPAYVPEAENGDILVKGRWLERGGSAWIVSTAGTGKSILSIQLALCWTMGEACCGLEPNVVNDRAPVVWIFQSEDSPSRVTIDREDVMAELRETRPGVDWGEAAKRVKFPGIKTRFRGKVGAEFVKALDEELELAFANGTPPDVVILNPFLAYVGGPVTDGGYVTPFLRGGDVGREHTDGLQAVIERHNVGLLVFHHTPKPPTDEQVKAWMKSAFPEYQGAGSSDITNWGRSFVTMMRVTDYPRVVCMTAGKNGGDLGWDRIGGGARRFMAYSDAVGITGRGRHAWRDLDDDELYEIKAAYEGAPKAACASPESDAAALAELLRQQPMVGSDIYNKSHEQLCISRSRVRSAFNFLKENLRDFGLCAATPKGTKMAVYGTQKMVAEFAEIASKNLAACLENNQVSKRQIAANCRKLPKVAEAPGNFAAGGGYPPLGGYPHGNFPTGGDSGGFSGGNLAADVNGLEEYDDILV